MATRANFVKKARKPIYQQGKAVTYQGQKGSKREGRTLTKIDRSQPAGKGDKILIQVGESYWWWQFMKGPKQYSKDRPRRSQLTQSEFYQWLWDTEDMISNFNVSEEELESYTAADFDSTRDEWINEIDNYREELEDRLNNMPEGLQDSSVLNERIEALESWSADLADVDIDWSDEGLSDDASSEWGDLAEAEVQRLHDIEGVDEEDWIKDRYLDLKRDKIDEIMSNIEACSANV